MSNNSIAIFHMDKNGLGKILGYPYLTIFSLVNSILLKNSIWIEYFNFFLNEKC